MAFVVVKSNCRVPPVAMVTVEAGLSEAVANSRLPPLTVMFPVKVFVPKTDCVPKPFCTNESLPPKEPLYAKAPERFRVNVLGVAEELVITSGFSAPSLKPVSV